MMKFKHNKKRNTAFLFEILVRELTKAVLKKDQQKKKVVTSLMKEFFNKEAVLAKELHLYRTLLESTDMHYHIAEKLLIEVKKEYNSIDKQEIFEAQSRLISKINKKISRQVYSNFVPNYKNIASIYQVFSSDMTPKSRVLLETGVINYMTRNGNILNQSKEKVDNLTIKTFIQKFNAVYGDNLNENQKMLLSKYVTSFIDNGIEFQLYLNEELSRLKNKLNESLSNIEIQGNSEVTEKTVRVLNLIETYKTKKIDSKIIEQILKIQKLTQELS